MGKRNARRDRCKESNRALGLVIAHDATDWGAEDEHALAEYLAAHDLLPKSQVWLADGEVLRLSSVLSSPLATRDAKKRAMILLAHSRNPRATAELGSRVATIEASLRHFAALALDESVQWSQAAATVLATLS